MLKEYWRFIREYWAIAELKPLLFLVSLLTAAAYKALEIAQPFVGAMIIKSLSDQNAEETYRNIIIFIVVYFGFRLALYLNWRAYSWNVNYSYCHLHDQIFNKLITVDQNFTRKISKGFFMNTINSDLISISEMADELAEFFTTPFQTIAIFIIVGEYGLIYPAIFFISNVIYFYVRNQADKNYNFYWQKTRREDDRYSNFLGQAASGLQEVKTFNMLPKLKRRLALIQLRYDKLYKKQRAERTIRDNDSKHIFYAFQAILYLLLIIGFVNGNIAIDVLVLIISYHESVTTCLNDFIDACIDIRLTNASVHRVRTILEYHPEKEYQFGNVVKDNLSGHIEFKNVSLVINRKSILKNINLNIKPHETVAIVGFPGAGKTMLFNVLLRLRQPTKGKVYLDDINIKDFSKEIYTSSVAVANQTPFIFNTSIRNNLDFVDTNIKKQIEACKIAGIHNFIETLPMGYNTILRENASNVSGGQKQMISIARTILTDAEIILLDDITTSLDPDTAKLVPALLKRLEKDRTVLMITKKPELMRLADRIVVLNKGEIEAIGTHSKLMKSSKTYRALQLRSISKEVVNA
ncbi:ABC transporter ATP-binding protein [Candidatus Saccharibacteria bacterium]|nr:ABC transporter ATP-binding protein [Candidatus Saccharibacteria bacterium]